MENLERQQCEPCRAGAPRATSEEVEGFLTRYPAWSVVTADGVGRLERVFRFRDFAAALAFTDRVGELAEAQGHHPRLVTEWGRVTVQWWTHKIGGLHRNDFVMAARTDALERGEA